ncbi:MAG: fibro-slime domain-containing protein [Chitinispirillaceae bacterium]|nr:fibro-slime domain-containing protein [Chitinispirillaceae bacterium]
MTDNRLTDNRGMVTVITLLVLLAIIALSVTMLINSRMNMTSANNYKNKIQTFYAADGVITGLAQEMIDTAENRYLVNRIQNQDIGTNRNYGFNGSYGYNEYTNTDTVKGAGLDIVGYWDDFHYAYRKIGPEADIVVQVIGLTNTSSLAVGGIMIRQGLHGNSQCASILRPQGDSHKIIFRCRMEYDIPTTDDYTETTRYPASWIRLKRNGNTFTGYRSNDGISWNVVGTADIPMSDSAVAGLAVCSNSVSAICTGIFKNFSGLIRRSYTDSVFLTASGDTWVKYTLDELSAGVFNMMAEGFKKMSDGSLMHVASLNQLISRHQSNSFVSGASGSVYLPVTYYDYRADLSNPEFNITYPGKVMRGMVLPNLDGDRKPIRNVNWGFRYWILEKFRYPDGGAGIHWYDQTPAQRDSRITYVETNRAATIDAVLASELPGYPNHTTNSWWFNDELGQWFRPSDAPSSSFDPLTGKWSNLKLRTLSNGNVVPNEWVGQWYNPVNKYATIVMYDSLKFYETSVGSGVFVFGDPAHNDPEYFITDCNPPWSPSDFKFMPLRNRGFANDAARNNPPEEWASCPAKENFGFTLEMHRKFVYKSGQTFTFIGDDDVWTYINNRLVIDVGGIHGACTSSVVLDTLGLTEGEEYWFDFFYCERMVVESNIYITTNLLMFAPPKRSIRNWRRDYGNID